MDGTRKEVTKLSAEVREKDAEIEVLAKKLKEAEKDLHVRDEDFQRLSRVLALVRAGDPHTLALLAESAPTTV